MAVQLDADLVRRSTASLMAYALKSQGFVAGQGGTPTVDFTQQTTPTLARASEVVERNSRLVTNDFPSAAGSDEPELRTIAALRSAIELENGTPSPDDVRIKNWREQLREYVGRFDSSGGDGAETPPGGALAPAWSFGSGDRCHPPGSEMPYPTKTGNEERWLRW